jgi:integrase
MDDLPNKILIACSPVRQRLKDGDQIRFVVNRVHDGQALAGKIRSAWDGILEDAGLGDDVVRYSLRHTAATWLMQADATSSGRPRSYLRSKTRDKFLRPIR